MKSMKRFQTCFIFFNIAWTLSALVIAFLFCSSPCELPNDETGTKGDETGASSDEFFSNWLELEIP